MLRRLGVEELIAMDAQDYVRIALRLGADADWRRKLRTALPSAPMPSSDDGAPTAAFARTLEELAGRGG